MSGSTTMRASLQLTLEDQLTNGLDKVLGAFDNLNRAIDNIANIFGKLDLNKHFGDNGLAIKEATQELAQFETKLKDMAGAADSVGNAFHNMWQKFTNSETGHGLRNVWTKFGEFAQSIGPIGGAAAGFGTLDVATEFANFDNLLTQIAIHEGLTGDKAVQEKARLQRMFYGDAQETGQSSESIGKAFQYFVTSGLSISTVDDLIGKHSRLATAYDISPEALGPPVLAMLQNLHIPVDQIGAMIGVMSVAAKSGQFKIEDFAREFPGIAGKEGILGMTGREGGIYGMAALEIAMRAANSGGQNAANFFDALNATTSRREGVNFKKFGVDIDAALIAGEKLGQNPIEVFLDQLDKLTKGLSTTQRGIVLHDVLTNQQSEQAFETLLVNRPDFNALRKKLAGVDESFVDRDYLTGRDSAMAQVRLFHENWDELVRTLGEGAMPVLNKVTAALKGINESFDWMDRQLPGLKDNVTTAGMAIVGLTGLIGVLGFVAPPFAKGLELVGAIGNLFGIGGALKSVATGLTAIDEATAAGGLGSKLLKIGAALAAPEALAVGGAVAGASAGLYYLDQYFRSKYPPPAGQLGDYGLAPNPATPHLLGGATQAQKVQIELLAPSWMKARVIGPSGPGTDNINVLNRP